MNKREGDMMPHLWKNAGFNFVDSLRIAIAQGCCLGGSTIINDALCFDIHPRVREEWNSLGEFYLYAVVLGQEIRSVCEIFFLEGSQ